jgi:hypothetical protein
MLTKRLLIKDKRAFRDQIEQLAGTPSLKRVIVSHGSVITGSPGEALRNAVATL